ncbi:MAG: hypothetical protein KDK23_11705 [Leptospiraceae bacterium]|nr:hypothetical protein [Leptospiraceae bacterium]
MGKSSLTQTAEMALAAYGGRKRWQSLDRIEAEVSVRGLAFAMKSRPFFRRARLDMKVHNPESSIHPIGKDAAVAGVLRNGDVELRRNGELLAQRNNARAAFSHFRQFLYWDDLDMAYFANYAFWNYFTLPALLLREDIAWSEPEPGRLQAVFPDSFCTHSRSQDFFFEQNGLLKQHNYTAAIISRFANAANVVKTHESFEGIPFATKRIVSPASGKGKALGFPVLIDIDVHSITLH